MDRLTTDSLGHTPIHATGGVAELLVFVTKWRLVITTEKVLTDIRSAHRAGMFILIEVYILVGVGREIGVLRNPCADLSIIIFQCPRVIEAVGVHFLQSVLITYLAAQPQIVVGFHLAAQAKEFQHVRKTMG
jgi:hypothetical protein